MPETATDVRRELESIRSLMDRARHYHHLPPMVPLLAGMLAVGASIATHLILEKHAWSKSTGLLALVWGSAFLLALGAQLVLSYRDVQREGGAFWSPLAAEIVHVLWPPLVVGCALTVAVLRHGLVEVVPSIWMLCYGVGGVAASAYARRAVRVLGLSFLLAGLFNLLYPLEPAWALGATFGGFHLIYGIILRLSPRQG